MNFNMEHSVLLENILKNNVQYVTTVVSDKSFEKLSLSRLRDATGNTILHTAVSCHCKPEMLFLLLEYVSPAVRNEDGLQVQDMFEMDSQKDDYKAVLEKFIFNKIKDGDTDVLTAWVLQGWSFKPIMQRVIGDLYDIVNEDLDGFLNYLCNLSDTVKKISKSGVQGEFSVVKRILTGHKCEPVDLITACDDTGETILHKLVICEQESVIIQLLNSFPLCINNVDHMERTPLHLAAALENPHCNLYEILESYGADPNSRDIKDLLPMDYRSKKHMIDMKMLKLSVLKSLTYSPAENRTTLAKNENRKVSKIGNASTFSKAENQYIEETLSRPLIQALATIVEKRPVDPIEFLATYLIRHNKLQIDTSNISRNPDSSKLTNNCQSVIKNGEAAVDLSEKFTISPEILQLNRMEERDFMGRTKIHQHVLLGGVHFFGLVAENCNFALRDYNGKTAKDLALDAGLNDAVYELDALILNIVNEGNLEALELLITLGYSDCFPDMTDIYGPDLFGIPADIIDFIKTIPKKKAKIENALDAVINQKPPEQLKILVSEMSIAGSFDKTGRSLIHRALLSRNSAAMHQIFAIFPHCLKLPDCLNRLPIHYAEALGQEIREEYFALGAPVGEDFLDAKGKLPKYYQDHPDELLD